MRNSLFLLDGIRKKRNLKQGHSHLFQVHFICLFAFLFSFIKNNREERNILFQESQVHSTKCQSHLSPPFISSPASFLLSPVFSSTSPCLLYLLQLKRLLQQSSHFCTREEQSGQLSSIYKWGVTATAS